MLLFNTVPKILNKNLRMKIVYYVSLGPHCLSKKTDTGTPRPKKYVY